MFSHRGSSGDIVAETGSRLGGVLGSSDQGGPTAAVEHRAVDRSASSGLVIDVVVKKVGGQHVGSGLYGG